LPTVIQHNITLLTQYYTEYKNKQYHSIIQTHTTPEQNKDTRYIPAPPTIPYIKTSIIECNPDRDIDTNKCIIETQNDKSHIYDDTGRYITTIPTTRIKWLWQQYNNNKYNTHRLIFAIHPFETEIVWLYQKYEHKNHKKNTIRTPHHTIPSTILDTIITTFNITHSYFSSPITCSMKSTQFYSAFARDKIFGSLGTTFQYKWKGIGYAHPNDAETAQQAIHWARLAAKQDPETVTFLAIPDTDWYQNQSPYTGPFPDAHTIIHFAADTITYDVPTISNEPNKTSNETRAIHILCIHHQHNNIGTTNQINTINTTIGNLQIS
jgi:hypothetical protein